LRVIILLYLLFFSNSLFSQKIFSVDYKSQADINVFVTDYRSQADLLVFKLDYLSEVKGNQGLWHFVNYKSQADKKIYFVEYKSQADLNIFFVEYKSQAGWKNKSKKQFLF
tara:strand:- start:6158 stop:6490 length:333 start_codon:yes stop_codon:yes gene_type:complete